MEKYIFVQLYPSIKAITYVLWTKKQKTRFCGIAKKEKNRKSNISPGCRVKFHVISLNGFTGYAYKVLTSQHLTFFVDLVYVNLTIV